MSRMSMVGAGYINGGLGYACQLVVTHEVIAGTSMGPERDKGWSTTDAKGHFHAYDQSAKSDPYPTLTPRVEQIPCSYPDHDEDCDGENIVHHHCRICDEEVKPGLIPGPHDFTIPGLSEWAAKVSLPSALAFGLIDRQVSFRMEFGDDAEVFGLARVYVDSISSGDVLVTADLIGTSALGRRTVVRPKASVAA